MSEIVRMELPLPVSMRVPMGAPKKAHRMVAYTLAWRLYHWKWPRIVVAHRDDDPLNRRRENLYRATVHGRG